MLYCLVYRSFNQLNESSFCNRNGQKQTLSEKRREPVKEDGDLQVDWQNAVQLQQNSGVKGKNTWIIVFSRPEYKGKREGEYSFISAENALF